MKKIGILSLIAVISLGLLLLWFGHKPVPQKLEQPNLASLNERFHSLSSENPGQLSQKAQNVHSRYEASDYDGAIALANQALKESPDDAEILRLKAESLIVLGRDEEALQNLKNILRKAPSNERALRDLLSVIELGPQDHQAPSKVQVEAENFLKELSHESLEAGIILALSYRKKNGPDAALELYDELLRRYPNHERLLRELSFRNFQDGQFVSSLEYVRKWREHLSDTKALELSYDLEFQNELGVFKASGTRDYRALEDSLNQWMTAQPHSRLALERKLYLDWLEHSRETP